ncbi:unnamed protein product [Arabis nemorensis]|uniref:Uncharacterized protein n=1 Tax=Arabis nemorensis TaxID=586526 RepID=A0A565CM56_9BRAS|nr:unnamed protein product [Arabis nemorensis]
MFPRWFILQPVQRRLKPIPHEWLRLPSMKMARASASASLVDGKIYMFGRLGDEADSSNSAESGGRWVDEEDQIFAYSPSTGMFFPNGKIDSKAGHMNDWCLIGDFLFCPVADRRILRCEPDELNWKKVEGLKELRDPNTKLRYDITKLTLNSAGSIVIFWTAQLQDHESLWELCSAEISLQIRNGCEMWGTIQWAAPVLDPLSHPYDVKVLYSTSVYV